MNKMGIFLRGMAMGVANLIPGISGGTICFITGAFERLVLAIKSVQITWIFFFLRYIFSQKKTGFTKAKKSFFSIDWEFLLLFGAGIVSIVFIGAFVISFILTSGAQYLIALFIGLIIASLFIIRKHIKVHGKKELLAIAVGTIIGIAISLLIPIGLELPTWALLFIGFIGTSAMFFPGISGSHMLFVLGAYETIIAALKSPLEYVKEIVLFGIGGIASLLIMSRAISYLLDKFHSITLYVLIGLSLGTLVIPVKELLAFGPFGLVDEFSLVVLGIVGLIIPIILENIVKK